MEHSAGELAQQGKELATKSDELSLISRTQTVEKEDEAWKLSSDLHTYPWHT